MRASLLLVACVRGQDSRFSDAPPGPSPPPSDVPSDGCTDADLETPTGKSPEAEELFQRLKGYWENKQTLTGQAIDSYDHLDTNGAEKLPAIKAFDVMNYANGVYDDNTIENIITWYKNTTCGKGIVTIQWHWKAGWSGKKPEFNTEPARNEGWDWTEDEAWNDDSKMKQKIFEDMNQIAEMLTKLKNQSVPVLWRPLHEARGNGGVDGKGAWFWWGSAGAEVYKQMWKWMHNKFVNDYALDNLIWVWSDSHRNCPYEDCHNEPDWYPAKDDSALVDIVGVDHYPDQLQHPYDYECHKTDNWDYYQDLTGCKKMIALTEVGSMPDFQKCLDEEDIHWLYFLSWGCGDTVETGCECDRRYHEDNEKTCEDGQNENGFNNKDGDKQDSHFVYKDNEDSHIADVYNNMPQVISLEDEPCEDEPDDEGGSTSTSTTSQPSLSPEQCHTCLTMCSPCKACTNGPDGTFPFGSCQKCWQCWDWDDDELEDEDEDMDKDCDALHGKHEWAEEEVRCLTKERQDCRACYGWSDSLILI